MHACLLLSLVTPTNMSWFQGNHVRAPLPPYPYPFSRIRIRMDCRTTEATARPRPAERGLRRAPRAPCVCVCVCALAMCMHRGALLACPHKEQPRASSKMPKGQTGSRPAKGELLEYDGSGHPTLKHFESLQKDHSGNLRAVCTFCGKPVNGALQRQRRHLAGIRGDGAPCPSVPPEVRAEQLALEQE